MSRLHDMKKGIAELPQKAASKALEAVSSYAAPRIKADLFKGEDPKKVRTFLTELSMSDEFPASAQLAAKKLLQQIGSGKPLDEAMQEETQRGILELQEQLEVTLKK
jgi:hypothetical protein